MLDYKKGFVYTKVLNITPPALVQIKYLQPTTTEKAPWRI